jgi:hypothetical protein
VCQLRNISSGEHACEILRRIVVGYRICLAYQYSETNVMHFLINLLRIEGLYMFRALLAYLQEALHKRHYVYCVHVMSVGCYQNLSVLVVYIYIYIHTYIRR